jgi:hypothetical protein
MKRVGSYRLTGLAEGAAAASPNEAAYRITVRVRAEAFGI